MRPQSSADLALLYLRTGSLLAPIAAHAVNNLVAVIVLLACCERLAAGPADSGLQSGGNAAVGRVRPEPMTSDHHILSATAAPDDARFKAMLAEEGDVH